MKVYEKEGENWCLHGMLTKLYEERDGVVLLNKWRDHNKSLTNDEKI